MKWSLILLFAGSMYAQDAQRFFYSKSFPGSVPAYVQVTLEKNGEAVYREAPDDELPLKFKLTIPQPFGFCISVSQPGLHAHPHRLTSH